MFDAFRGTVNLVNVAVVGLLLIMISPTTAVLPEQNASPMITGYVRDEQQQTAPEAVRVISVPGKGWSDWIIFGGNVLLVAVGIGGVLVANRTLGYIETQTSAIKTQAKHMVESERPFLMVEAVGDADTVRFKLSNKGRSPAKILYCDKFSVPQIVSIQNELPTPPEYGNGYNNANAGAELLNPDWIAPQDYIYFGTYQPRAELAMIPEDEQRVRSGSHNLWLYGVVVYKGLFSDDPYESRYCYRLGSGSWHMLGPDGYNEYR